MSFNYTFNDTYSKNSLSKTEDGFLRCKCRVMRTGELLYTLQKNSNDDVNYSSNVVSNSVPVFDNKIRAQVIEEDLTHEDSLKSLEGVPVLAYFHEWVTPENNKYLSVGNISGSPQIERDENGNTYIVCDAIITDPDVIKDIENKELVETSAAYRVKDTEPTQEGFSCRHSEIRYNHILFCPRGTGRAGRDVRIYNCNNVENSNNIDFIETEKVKMQKINFGNGKILNIDDTDVQKAEQLISETTAEIKERDQKIFNLEAEISELKTKVENAIEEAKKMSEESKKKAEEMAKEMTEDMKDAEIILDCNVPSKKEKIMNSLIDIHGYDLYKAVLDEVGIGMHTKDINEGRAAYKAIAAMSKKNMKPRDDQSNQKITNAAEFVEEKSFVPAFESAEKKVDDTPIIGSLGNYQSSGSKLW